MFTVDAGLSQTQPLHRTPLPQMFAHDLLHIARMHVAVPDRLRIDHHHRPVLALVQAAGLVGPNSMLQTGFLDRVLES